MSMRLRRKSLRRRYALGVPIARRPSAPLLPVPRPAGLEEFAGMWVLRLGDSVIAAAPTSRELAYELHKMDHRKRADVVMEYVRPSSDAFIVGAG